MTNTKREIEIKNSRPPQWIWDEAHRVFEIDDHETVYTYGYTIHDTRTAEYKLAPSIIVHEIEHMKQQAKTEGGPDAWWRKYFDDPEFRKKQEIEAYRVQYQHACTIYRDRNDQARYLDIIAGFASSPMYKMGLTKGEALKLIKQRQ